MGKTSTQPSEPPHARELTDHDTESLNSRPTPAVPLRVWSENDSDDEPTSVIRADRLAEACEALKKSDNVDLSALRFERELADQLDGATKVEEQKFWDGRPSHLALSKQAHDQIEARPSLRQHVQRILRVGLGALLFALVAVLAFQVTARLAERSPTIQALLNRIYN